CTTGDSGW
nr:immunoglobulin heavy chain junction region [Macaca mulatta]